ncbi:MAG: hypothetical protein IJQ99_03830 [Synergistaceae bacterium]|nr:hypothetical protein [Synergistaceae bacterium]
MATKKEIFAKIRDMFKGVHIGFKDGKEFDSELEDSLFNALNEAMDKTDSFDAYYLKNIPQRNGTGYYMLYHLVEDNAPLKDCFTALTFLLRNHKQRPGGFSSAVNENVVYEVLDRVCKLL